jgi:hypothetical protein
MIAPIQRKSDGMEWPPEHQKGREIRAKYPTSGLYKNDGSTKASWTIDWYAYSVLLPSDGIHLIRRGPWAKDGSTEALTLFASGREDCGHPMFKKGNMTGVTEYHPFMFPMRSVILRYDSQYSRGFNQFFIQGEKFSSPILRNSQMQCITGTKPRVVAVQKLNCQIIVG